MFGGGDIEALLTEPVTEAQFVAALEDGAVDTLDGGAGADVLALGAGDIVTGGSGADGFLLDVGIVPETQSAVTRITDFTEGEDFITIDYGTGSNVSVTPEDIAARQTLTDDGVLLSFDAGESQSVLIEGLTQVLDANSFRINN